MIKFEVRAKEGGVNMTCDISGRGDKVAREALALLTELGDAMPREMWFDILEHYLEQICEVADDDENDE